MVVHWHSQTNCIQLSVSSSSLLLLFLPSPPLPPFSSSPSLLLLSLLLPLSKVVDGYRLTQPQGCPDELYSLMVKCWAQRPTDRPHFPSIIKHHLDPLEAKLKGCVCREGGRRGVRRVRVYVDLLRDFDLC